MKKGGLVVLLLMFAVSFAFAGSLSNTLAIPKWWMNGGVHFYDANDLSEVKSLEYGDKDNGCSATISPGGEYFYVSYKKIEDPRIDVIAADTFEVVNSIKVTGVSIRPFGTKVCPIGLFFNAEDNTIYAGTDGHGILAIKLKDNLYEVEQTELMMEGTDTIPFAAQNCVVIKQKIYTLRASENNLYIYDLKTKTSNKVVLSEIDTRLASVYVVGVSPDEKWLLITNNNDSTARGALIDLTTINNATPTAKIFPRDVYHADFSKDGKYVYYTSKKDEGYLFKSSIDDLTSEEKASLNGASGSLCIGLSDDGEYGYVISSTSSRLSKVNLTKMTLEKQISIGTPAVIGFLPSAYSYKQYKQVRGIDIAFDYNGRGGTNFFVNAKPDQTAQSAATSPTNYTSLTDAAKAQIADWNSKVVSPSAINADFLGWYTDPDFNTPANLDDILSDSVTFYAKWIVYHHDWKFYYEKGNIYAYCDNPLDNCRFFGKENAIGLEIKAPYTGKQKITVEPYNATNKRLSFVSSNPSVVTVDKDGNLKALSEGTSEISLIAQDESGVSTSYTVEVIAEKTE